MVGVGQGVLFFLKGINMKWNVVTFKIWTSVTESISYVNNCYAKCTSVIYLKKKNLVNAFDPILPRTSRRSIIKRDKFKIKL